MKIDAVSERLDDGDNTGLECFPRRSLKIKEKPFFRGRLEKWRWGVKMAKMVTDGRSSMYLQKASNLSKQWGPPHRPLFQPNDIYHKHREYTGQGPFTNV